MCDGGGLAGDNIIHGDMAIWAGSSRGRPHHSILRDVLLFKVHVDCQRDCAHMSRSREKGHCTLTVCPVNKGIVSANKAKQIGCCLRRCTLTGMTQAGAFV